MTETAPESIADAADLSTPETDTPQPVETATEAAETPAPRAPRTVIGGPVGATGRRKEAIARVRLVPGTGTWTINGRTLGTTSPTRCTSRSSTSR